MAVEINTMQDLLNFFSTPEKPLDTEEFWDFWLSLTGDQQKYYKKASLV